MQNKKYGIPLKELAPMCREAAAEGIVLLRNEENMLPIKAEDNIAIFGRCQIDYYRSGTGSGGAVNVAYSTNLIDGLRNYPWVRLNEKLIQIYQDWIAEHPFDNGGGAWAAEPWHQEEMPLADEVVAEAAAVSNKAFVIIGRTAGEDKDNTNEAGSYCLTDDEKAMIAAVVKHFKKVAIIFNVSNIVDMGWLSEDWCASNIKALIYTWHGGQEGGNASADILTGAVSPSGHLTDTIACAPDAYPAFHNYGSETQNVYEEDIYVGYRYFETFCPEKVMFPFGYGLSYTTFDWNITQADVSGEGADAKIKIEAEVTNTGACDGKEVLQVYVEAPQGRLGQPVRALIDFAKTKTLKPGESQKLVFETEVKRMASYDDGGYTGNKSCYVIEAGEYLFHVGVDCRNTKQVMFGDKKGWTVEQTFVTERLQEAAAPIQSFQRIKPAKKADGTFEISYEEVPLKTNDLKQRIMDNLPEALPETNRQDILFKDVKEGRATLEEFVAQLSVKEMATIVRGEGMCSPKVTPGTAAAFGGITNALNARGIPAGCAADGPSGLRMDTGEQATQVPIGTLLACSFNKELVEQLFYYVGKELIQNDIDTLLGPGINLHRHPLNGRNFEYFSEDPYITGAFAAACEHGIDRAGTVGTIKHYACNSQEKARRTVEAVVSERALRQMYLKGFELAVKEGHARSVMTAYNPINGYQSASHYDLTTTILRGEWGFEGIVMTDWWAFMNDAALGGEACMQDTASMLRAQNDLYMVVPNNGAAINVLKDNTEQAVAEGKLSLGELQRCVMNIIRFLLASPASLREVEIHKPVVIKALDTAKEAVDGKTKMETNELKVLISDNRFTKEDVWVKIEKAGVYSINVELMSKESDRAQLLCQLYLNGEKAADIQTNGTWGRWFSQQIATVELEKGYYQLSIRHVKPGIELGYAEFEEEV